MEKKFLGKVLMMASFVAVLGGFSSCQDYTEEVKSELLNKLETQNTTLEQALEAQKQALEAKIAELQAAMTNAAPKKKKVAFKNGVEQLIALATPSTPGASVPPLPHITDEGLAQDLERAMQNVIKADEDDSEATLEKKLVVAEAKEEFRELREKEGFTITEYLNALRDQANQDADFLAEAHKMSNELYHDQTVSDEDYIKYRNQINEKLRERALPEIE